MNDQGYEQVLAEFKAQEKPEGVLLLAEDTDLIRIAVAWPNMTVSRPRKFTRLAERASENERWEWLWHNTEFSRQEMMEKADQSFQGLGRKFKALTGNRILYPDGSINSFAQRYLRERTA